MEKFITEPQLDNMADFIAQELSSIKGSLDNPLTPYIPNPNEGPIVTGESGFFRIDNKIYRFPVVEFIPLATKIYKNGLKLKYITSKYKYSDRQEEDIIEDYENPNNNIFIDYNNLKGGILRLNLFNGFKDSENSRHIYPELAFQISEDYVDGAGNYF